MAEQLPSNKEIKRTAENIKQEIETTKAETEGLTGVGERLLDDTARVVDSVEQMVLDKNRGDKLQKLAKEGQKASKELRQQGQRLKQMQADALSNIDSDRIRELATRLMEIARRAGLEIVSSPSFRQNLSDLTQLMGDIIQGSVEEKEEEKGGESSLKQQIKGIAQEELLLHAGSIDEAKARSEAHGRKAARRAPEKAQELKGEVVRSRAGPPAEQLARGEGQQTENIKRTVEGVVNPVLESAGAGVRVKLSKQQLDQLWERFSTLMRQITERERSKRVFNGLLELLRIVGDQLRGVGDRAGDQLEELNEELQHSKHLNRTLELSKEMFESVTNKNIDQLIHHTRELINIVNEDAELRTYFDELRGFMAHIIEGNPDLLRQEATAKQGRQLIKRGRNLGNRKVYGHIQAIIGELRDLGQVVSQDPHLNRMREAMNRLVSDLMLDSSGNFVYKPEVLDQLKIIIVNSIVDRLRVPLPTISVEGKDLDFEVSGLVLCLSDIVPERVLIESRGKVLLDPKQMEIEGAAHGLRITMNNINVHMPEANLWFKRKTFPKVEDEGRASIDIGGRGMDLIITLRTFAKPPNFFRVQQVDCNVHNLALSLSETHHDFVYNTLLKMFSGTVKSDIESSIADNIRHDLQELNHLLKNQWEKAQLSGQPLQESIRSGVEKVQKTLGTVV